MDPVVTAYIVYIVLDVALTVWVARTLSRNGRVYLEDVFRNERLATAMNQLLVVGFYLVNFGFAALWLSTDANLADVRQVFQFLALKLGTVLLVVGALHLTNLVVFSRVRHNALNRQALGPARPQFQAEPMPPLG